MPSVPRWVREDGMRFVFPRVLAWEVTRRCPMNCRHCRAIAADRPFDGELTTAEGEAIEIVNNGYRNTDSGPDFKEAKIRIGSTLWAGNVEIHVRTSDWNRHRHQYDKAYDNVILHVVYENDATVNDIPVLELKSHFDESLFDFRQ